MADRDINLNITADDEASKVLDKVADRLDEIDDETTVEIDADVGDAQREIDRFESKLDAITSDRGREVLIEFRGRKLESDIRSATKALDRLEDPIEIEAKTADLERAQTDLEDLRKLAADKYEVDLKVKGTGAGGRTQIADARDDVAGLNETAQSGVGPLRGFTDELGDAAGQGGIMGAAVIDAGEAIEIFGRKAGISEQALGKISGAIAGIGLAVGAGVAVWQAYRAEQEKVREQAAKTTDALLDQLGIVEGIEDRFEDIGSAGEAFADVLLGDEDQRRKALSFLDEFGLTIDDLPRALAALNRQDAGFFADLLTGRGVNSEAADELGRIAVGLGDVGDGVNVTDFPGLADGIADVTSAARSLQAETAAADTINAISTASVEGRDRVAELREQLDGATNIELLDAYLSGWTQTTEEINNAERAAQDLDRGGIQPLGKSVDTVVKKTERIDDGFDAATIAAQKLDREIRGIDNERRGIQIQKDFATAAEKIADAGDNTADARIAMLDLKTSVADYASEVAHLPAAVTTKILADLDNGDVAEVEAFLLRIGDGVTLPIKPYIIPNSQGGGIRVDEHGNVTNVGRSAPAATSLTVNLPRAAEARDVTAALDRWARVN